MDMTDAVVIPGAVLDMKLHPHEFMVYVCLKRLCDAGPPDTRASERELAQILGVSKETVFDALMGLKNNHHLIDESRGLTPEQAWDFLRVKVPQRFRVNHTLAKTCGVCTGQTLALFRFVDGEEQVNLFCANCREEYSVLVRGGFRIRQEAE